MSDLEDRLARLERDVTSYAAHTDNRFQLLAGAVETLAGRADALEHPVPEAWAEADRVAGIPPYAQRDLEAGEHDRQAGALREFFATRTIGVDALYGKWHWRSQGYETLEGEDVVQTSDLFRLYVLLGKWLGEQP